MEVLNNNGQILMDYRAEFKRHYADSVDSALKNAVYTLYKEKKINERVFRMLLDENIDDLEVYTYLLTQRDFTKTAGELNYEFDKVRQKVNDCLISIGMIDGISTKNSIATNRIIIIKQFDVPKDVLLSYFGLSSTEIIPLMKRRGFMDKFCVLRLNQIFKEIYSELKLPENVDQGYSLVYYNKEIQGFSIDYKYMVNINYISQEGNIRPTLLKIKDLNRQCEKKFQNKLDFTYFSNQGGSPKQKQRDNEKQQTKPEFTPSKNAISEKKRDSIESPKNIVQEAEKSTENAPTVNPENVPTDNKNASAGQQNQNGEGQNQGKKNRDRNRNRDKSSSDNQQSQNKQFEEKPNEEKSKFKPAEIPEMPDTEIDKKYRIPDESKEEPKPATISVMNIPSIELDEEDTDML